MREGGGGEERGEGGECRQVQRVYACVSIPV